MPLDSYNIRSLYILYENKKVKSLCVTGSYGRTMKLSNEIYYPVVSHVKTQQNPYISNMLQKVFLNVNRQSTRINEISNHEE